MLKHQITTKSGERETLTTCDTFTLAIGKERRESTPRDLAEIATRRSLVALKGRTSDQAERAKLEKAILMSDYLA